MFRTRGVGSGKVSNLKFGCAVTHESHDIENKMKKRVKVQPFLKSMLLFHLRMVFIRQSYYSSPYEKRCAI